MTEPSQEQSGRLQDNLLQFVRLLRRAGMAIGPGRALVAMRALEAVGVQRREDFYWALHSVFVHRRGQHELFDHAFALFWCNPRGRNDVLTQLLSMAKPMRERRRPPGAGRLRGPGLEETRSARRPSIPPAADVDAVMTWSDREVLRHKDFEQMTAEEFEEAKRTIADMRLPALEFNTRRLAPARRAGRLDMRRTLKAGLRAGGQGIPLRWRRARRRAPAIVALCDISGSMSRYSRLLLHFLHAWSAERVVHSFTFGTELNNVTRHIRHRDVDVALARIGAGVTDWSGGTRIGACLKTFNQRWSRRVLGQGAMVLLITDGLDRDAGSGLAQEMERLHKSSRRLIWLNPLLRFAGFAPRAAGIRAMLPHVDDFRTIHNLQSMRQLSEALTKT